MKDNEARNRDAQMILSGLVNELPGMVFRCRSDPWWTMTYLSEGCEKLTGYSSEELIDNRGRSYVQLIHPADRPRVRKRVEESLSGNSPYEIIYRLLAPGKQKWVWERGHGVDSTGEYGIIEGFVTDVTRKIKEGGNLRGREEKSPELSVLMDIVQDVASTLELDTLLGKILDKLGTVLEYDAASILTLEEDILEVSAYRGPIDQEKARKISFQLEEAGANREVIARGEPVVIDDVRSDEPLARELRKTAGEDLTSTFDYLRCWMGIPLILKNRVLGMLTLDHKKPRYYSFRDAEVALAFANQVAIAIENARLYRREKERLETSERRRCVAESLRETLSALNSNQSLETILDTLLDQSLQSLEADGAAVYRVEEDEDGSEDLAVEVTAKNMPEEFWDVGSFSIVKSEMQSDLSKGGPLVVEDLTSCELSDLYDSSPLKELYRVIRDNFGASLSIPMSVEEDLFGFIILYYAEPREFSEEEIDSAVSFADQAVLALENARLNRKLEEAAVIEERNRMARELHDSVNQSLYSVTLFAEAAKRMTDRGDLDAVRNHLESVESMSLQALKEMRLLIYQMRGESRGENRLEAKVKNRFETVERRSGVETSIEVLGNPDFSELEEEQLFLITQEALNNAQKHAEATRVEVKLNTGESGTTLTVTDDGRGFDVESCCEGGGMGLENMKERADRIGASISIDSEPGTGTTISVKLNQED